jgi:hypothetical protein
MPIFLLANGLLAQHLFSAIGKAETIGVYESLLVRSLVCSVSFIMIYYFRLGYWGLIASGFCIDINHLHCIREVCMDRF